MAVAGMKASDLMRAEGTTPVHFHPKVRGGMSMSDKDLHRRNDWPHTAVLAGVGCY